MSCYQVNVGGSGSASPGTVSFPGAYSAEDPVRLSTFCLAIAIILTRYRQGILINIYTQLNSYVSK